MSARAKRPTDDPDERTSVYDPDARRRPHKPTKQGVPGGLIIETPTEIDRPGFAADAPRDMVDAALAQRSEPIRAISMKEAVGEQRAQVQRRELAVQLRSMSDVRRPDTPADLGRLAPPRDPREVRARRVRDLVIWACVAIIFACGVTLVVWFAARR